VQLELVFETTLQLELVFEMAVQLELVFETAVQLELVFETAVHCTLCILHSALHTATKKKSTFYKISKNIYQFLL
jgi:hypothetical protein